MSNLPLRRNRPPVEFYGISLKENPHRTWKEDGPNYSKLIYHWEDIITTEKETYNDISIAVAQHYPNEQRDEVKSIAFDIYESGRINELDSVFGIEDNRLKKIGYISEKETEDNRRVIFAVKWVAHVEDGQLREPILTDGAGIAHLKGRKVSKLEKQFPTEFALAYQNIPVKKKQYDSEKNIQIGSVPMEFITADDILPKEEGGGKITLFYGTNRNALEKEGDKQKYGSDVSELRYGTCEVQIPRGHIQGELEYPEKILGMRLPEDEQTDIVIKKVQEFVRADFISDLQNKLNNAPEKQALLFVHGYNNSFEEAARRCGQLGWDIPFEGLTGFFSWPSSGTIPAYLADETKAKNSKNSFIEFLRLMLTDTGIEQLHIIAHSMGSLLLTLSLSELSRDTAINKELEKIHQIILGAPDIDKTDFEINILPEFKKVGERRTLYTSDHDKALKYSSLGRIRLERLGQVGKKIFVADGIDTVEASNIESDSSHSYMFENPLMLSDLYYLVTKGLPPKQRRLRQINKQTLPYWLFLK